MLHGYKKVRVFAYNVTAIWGMQVTKLPTVLTGDRVHNY
jgi:hypothetical protein